MHVDFENLYSVDENYGYVGSDEQSKLVELLFIDLAVCCADVIEKFTKITTMKAVTAVQHWKKHHKNSINSTENNIITSDTMLPKRC